MTDDKLTFDEIEILMEALDALESKGASEDLMGLVLGGLATPKENVDSFFDERMAEIKEKESQRKVMKEQIILVKAKLIRIRDRAEVEEHFEDPT